MFGKISFVLFAMMFILILGWHTNTAIAQIVEEGLVSYWSFDRDSVKGGIVTDAPANKEGVIVGDPQIVVGKIGEGLEFDGDDYIEIPDDVGGKDSITITVWVKPTDFGSDRTVIGYWADTPTSEILLYYKSSTNIWRFIVRESGGSATDVTFPEPKIDEWTHLAASYGKGGEVRLYVNGVVERKDAPENPLNAGGGPWLGIGWDNSNSHPPFMGIMDEVCFYDRVLSQEEIERNYNAVSGPSAIADDKLTTAWGKVKS